MMNEARVPESETRNKSPQPRRILVVDDERPIRDIIGKVLSAAGHIVESCGDGRAAVEKTNGARYDLVILDFNLPITNGAEVIRDLRAQGNQVPILFTSCQTEEMLGSLSGGAALVFYLPKPFRLEDLCAAVVRAMAA